MRYIATREGVEKLAGNSAVTKGQRELIQKLLHDFPDAVELFEYEDYCRTPTLGTASAFISMALDANLHEIDPESGYMQYIATRPRVQKRGTHGLFSSATAVDLASAISELEAHEGNVWTIIYSLRREDAARLEYDNADAWRTLLMENAPTLAKSMKISLENFHWYAAFHDEGHHPHIHMMVWSDDPKEGFLTKDGIAAMRSKLTNAIFRDEMQQIYARKDVAYSDLVEAAQNAMREMISRMQRQVCDSPIIEDSLHHLRKIVEGIQLHWQVSKLCRLWDDPVIVENHSTLPAVRSELLLHFPQCFSRRRQFQRDGAVIFEVGMKAKSEPEEIFRLFGKFLGAGWCGDQFTVLHHIAAPCECAVFAGTQGFADFAKVQHLEHIVG